MKNFIFFGTSNFAVLLLDGLKKLGITPKMIVTTPDMPAGRNLTLTPPPVKVWAEENKVEYLQPEKLKDQSFIEILKNSASDYFLIAAYGKIIPKEILNILPEKVLNVHPSLLPLYRGSSPIQYQTINNEAHIGTSIMIIDEDIDHGPIIAQKEINVERKDGEMTEDYSAIERKLAVESAALFGQNIEEWLEGKIRAKEQDHTKATFTKMIEKKDGLLDISKNQRENYRKYLALSSWPGTFFFQKIGERNIRVIIKKAIWVDGFFKIERVLPEGKKEMSYDDFLRGLK